LARFGRPSKKEGKLMATSASTVVPLRPGHKYGAYPAPKRYGHSFSEPIDPTELHLHLDVAPYVRLMKFNNEKHLMRYRALLYRVNVQGKFRYATRREGWSSLIILRLK